MMVLAVHTWIWY